MKVTKTQLKNGKFQYSVNVKGENVIIVNSSTKEFKQFIIRENYNGSIDKITSTSNSKNLKSLVDNFINSNTHNSKYFNNKSMLKNKFHICQVKESSDTEILINGTSCDLIKELESTFGVKF